MSNLMPEWTLGELSLTDHPYSVVMDSFDPGQPSLEDEPREMAIKVGIEGADLLELAENEAALRREINKDLNEFGYTPGDGFAPTSVFDTTSIQATPIRYEDGGEQVCYREWELSIEAEPHARSATLTVAEPLSVGGSPSITVFDACDSETGWTATVDGVAASATTFYEAGTVGVAVFDDNPDSDADTIIMRRTGVVDFTGAPYLIVEARTTSASSNLIVREDGTELSLLDLRHVGGDHFEYTFLTSGGSTSYLEFEHTRTASDTSWLGLFIYDLTKSNMPPGATARQLSRVIPVGGTERTPGSIHVSSANGTDPLGLVIVQSQPQDGSGNSPELRRWRVSGEVETPSATALSGKFEDIAVDPGGFVAEVPTSALPEGGYVLCARMHAPGGTYPEVATLAYSTSTIFPDSTTQQGYVNGTVEITFPDADWVIVPVAVLSLPSVRTAAGKVQIVLQVTSTDHPNVYLDEAWLFRADDDCALTIVETDQPHLWLDSPDITSPVPRVWVGDSIETRVHPGEGLHAQGAHVLSADGTTVFTAALTDWAAVDASFYRRYHSNAAD